MELLRKLCLVCSAALLVGCGETGVNEYDLKGYQASSWQWSASDADSPEITQSSVSATTADVNSIEAAEPANQNRSQITTGAVIAVIGLIALVLLADDASACSGSGCASKSR